MKDFDKSFFEMTLARIYLCIMLKTNNSFLKYQPGADARQVQRIFS
jgi:hypothetical protein